MGLNTYREREAAKTDKKKATDAMENLSKIVSKGQEDGAKTSEKMKKSLVTISKDLADFKNKVRPDEMLSEMSGLRSTMQKVIDPPKGPRNPREMP